MEPEQSLEGYIAQETHRYVEGLAEYGIVPGPVLIRALSQRIAEQIEQAKYTPESSDAEATLYHRIEAILAEVEQRRRSQATIWLVTWMLLAIFFALGAAYHFVWMKDGLMGVMYTVMTLVSLGMLMLESVFDRPGKAIRKEGEHDETI